MLAAFSKMYLIPTKPDEITDMHLKEMYHESLIQENDFLTMIVNDILAGQPIEPIEEIDLSNRELDALIIAHLTSAKKGASTRDILKKLQDTYASLDKKRINTRLYTMLMSKKVRKSADTAPIWKII